MEILNRLRQGIRISEDPFGELAKEMGIEKKELIDEILKLRDEKIIKGMRVLLDQNALGLWYNLIQKFK
ncbi:MAG: Lrp/AsnC family transcriptional regulator [Thermoplasmata archaeon]